MVFVLADHDPGTGVNNLAAVLMCLVILVGTWFLWRTDQLGEKDAGPNEPGTR